MHAKKDNQFELILNNLWSTCQILLRINYPKILIEDRVTSREEIYNSLYMFYIKRGELVENKY